MFRPDPRTSPASPQARTRAPGFDELDTWADERDEGAALLRLVGAATLAIVALAVASVLLV